MRFTAIDVETANADCSSICQVGVVWFCGGSVARTWQQLVNPEDYFEPWNVSIHGITEEAVSQAPAFPEIFGELQALLAGQIVVCHTAFDRVSLTRASEKYGLPTVDCTWLDSAKVVRRTWPEHAYRGYGLANIAQTLGIVFRHHEAQEDARAAGEVVLRAIAESGTSLKDWLVRVRQPVSPEAQHRANVEKARIARDGNPEGPLAGEVLVFTGALSIPRREAADAAANAGCAVAESVNKATTLLVVGDQDFRKLAGHRKSSKHRRADALMEKGQAIRILTESDFERLLDIERSA